VTVPRDAIPQSGLTGPTTERAMDESFKVPFMTDQGHLQSLDKQRYIVVRPIGEIVSFYKSLQKELLSLFSPSASALSHPNYPHMMIRGFPEGTDLQTLRQIVDGWTKTISPLPIKLKNLSYFPDPYRVVLFEIEKNGALIDAYNGLAAAAVLLPQFEPRRSADEWTFHMSILYGKELPAAEWEKVIENINTYTIPSLDCVVDTIELVSYENATERYEVFHLGQSDQGGLLRRVGHPMA
jgi:2'-5' RNA ligase